LSLVTDGIDALPNASARVLTFVFPFAASRFSFSRGNPMIPSGDNASVFNFSEWTLLSHTCAPDVVGNSAGLLSVPPPVIDVTNAFTGSGGLCRFDLDPPTFPVALTPLGVSNVSRSFVGVGNYTLQVSIIVVAVPAVLTAVFCSLLQYRAYDGCNVVTERLLVQASAL
jgi:hypothetical protein